MNRGFTITAAGAALLTSLLAGEQLEITKVMVGKGKLAEDQEPADLTDLISPVALATSNTPAVSGQQVEMVVEYRNDLNGGLTEAFYLSEFGVWGKRVGDAAEVAMIYYATLGDYPQWVGPISSGLDVRRYPVAIGLATKDVGVQLNYPAVAFVTAEEFNSALGNKASLQFRRLLGTLKVKQLEITDFAAPFECGQFIDFNKQGSKGSYSLRLQLTEDSTGLAIDTGGNAQRVITSGVKIPVGADLNDYTRPGMYYIGVGGDSVQNSPSGKGSFSLLVEKTGAYSMGIKQTVTDHFPGTTYIRLAGDTAADHWGGWKALAMCAPPREIALPFEAGVTPAAPCRYRKNSFEEGSFYLFAKCMGQVNDLQTIARLPEGFRPAHDILFNCGAVVGGVRHGANTITVKSDGALVYAGPPLPAGSTFWCHGSYVCAA